MKPLLCLPLVILLAGLNHVYGSVVLSANAAAPIPGASDQSSFVSDGVVSGGNYPYNISAYSDNTPGQSFTTPAGSYNLTSFSLKGSGDMGGLDNSTWTITIGSVSRAGNVVTFTPLNQVSGILTPVSLSNTDWLTWTFSGGDVLTLAGNTMYGIQVENTEGYFGFAASTIGSNPYPDGYAFAESQPGWSEYPNPVSYDYDRTFVVGLSAVPEPGSAILLLGGMALLFRRSRRNS